MSRRPLVLSVLVSALLLGMVAGPSWAAKPAHLTMRGGMSGAQEVPGPGDPDGSGKYTLTFEHLSGGTINLCWTLRVRNIAAPAAAHIHTGARHESGAPVITLDPLTAGPNGTFTGCRSDETADAQAVLADPRAYYVNVHTSDFSNGAVRGQLHPVGKH